MRRIYARAALEKEEVNLLRGVLTLTQEPRRHDNINKPYKLLNNILTTYQMVG